jgi:hypothetical protein
VPEEKAPLDGLSARPQGRAEETHEPPEPEPEAGEGAKIAEIRARAERKNRALKRARRLLAEKDKELAGLRASLAGRREEQTGSIRPENMVWIFGAGRTGSTWLAAMMEEMENQSVWFEPRVGQIFDPFRFQLYRGANFVLSPKYEETWLQSIRTFVLDGANVRFPEVSGPDKFLMIKDPAGSVGAPLVMKALPESRVALLVRDPRDVVASWLNAAKKGGWQYERRKNDRRREVTQADTNPDAFVKRHAEAYLRNVGNAKEAYDAHEGRKALVRYEDLRADTLGEMRRLYASLGIPVEEEELAKAVQKHSWENIPEEEKGEGKFYRKAEPGGWREDLTPKQVRRVERITAPLLRELYPDA